MTSTFTFVNTVDAPSLSASSAKAMRAHVTKTNFANRRKRIAAEHGRWRRGKRDQPAEGPLSHLWILHEPQGQYQSVPTDERLKELPSPLSDRDSNLRSPRQKGVPKTKRPERESVSGATARPSLASMRPTDPYLTMSYLTCYFCPVMFPSGETPAGGPDRASWADLLINEPAFSEATLAIGVSYKPVIPLRNGFSTPENHVGRAISLVNARLNDPHEAVSDGVLAAVFTLAVWEKLKGTDDERWGIHIDGLARMLAVRKDQGGERLPEWLLDAFMYNGFAVSTLEQKKRYQQVLDAIALTWDGRATIDIPLTSMYMAQLVRGIELHRGYGMTPGFIEREIEQPIEKLNKIADRLKTDPHPFMRASGFAILTFTGLSWPERATASPAVLASNLRKALEKSSIRLCSTIELLVWKLLTGGVAAERESEDRQWFMTRLASIIRTMPPTSWSEILVLLKRAFMPDVLLLERMKTLWDECSAQCVHGKVTEGLRQGTAIADKVYP